MSIGLGGNITVHQKKAPAASGSGAPFTANSADNGTSVNTAGGGEIVLGNDINDIAAPAALLNNREIRTNGFTVAFKDVFAALERYCLIGKDGIFAADDPSNFTATITPGAGNFSQFNAGVGTGPSIMFEAAAGLQCRMQLDGGGQMVFYNAANIAVFTIDMASGNVTFPAITRTETIITGDISTVADTWKLGNVRAAAVALDATRYVEIEIGGVVHRLGIVT